MAQTYTLEEASHRLGIPAEEFKRRLRDEWKQVRSFRDGATLRFRAADIDELARALGQASDPGVPLGEAATPLSDSSEDVPISLPKSGKKGKKPADAPLFLADDSDDIFALPAPEGSKVKAKKGDSDVRLDLTPSKRDAAGNQPTEELELDVSAPASGVGLGKSSAKLTPPKSSGRMTPPKIPTPNPDATEGDGSSEFELSLDSDSDSFELQLTNDSSEEVPLGGDTGGGAGQSGINLGKPADSGVSIEKKKKKAAVEDSDGDFELSLDTPSGAKSGGKRKAAAEEEGSSEFELTLDDSSGSESMNSLAASEQAQGDIFETDFELPVMAADDESGSEVVPVDSSDTDLENSDFDLAISDADAPGEDGESASEVVLMDEDGEEAPAAKSRPRKLVDSEDDDLVAAVSDDDDDEPIRSAAAPAKWGILPILFLAPTFLLVVLGGIMAFELVRGMAGYQQPGATSAPLVRGMAGMFGMKTAD